MEIGYISLLAEGRYNSANALLFVTPDIIDKLKELDIVPPSFHDLDGKHSDVDSEMSYGKIESDSKFKEIIDSYETSTNEYLILDIIIADNFDEFVYIAQRDFNKKITDQIEVKTVKEYYFNGLKIG